MLETVFILLIVFAIILILLAIEYHHNQYWQLVFLLLAIPLWFILGLSVMKIERPWTMYNSSSSAIESGITEVTSPVSPYLSYFFTGIALCLIIYLIVVLVMWFKEE